MITVGNLNASGVYKISHPSTHRIYIGSAENLKDRAKNHKSYIKTDAHHAKMLRNFAKKANKSLFKFEVIEYCDICKLVEREQYYLDTLLKASDNNADFWRLGFNSNRKVDRGSGEKLEKPILQYSLDGDFIKEWRSAKVASKELNIAYTTIIQAILISSIRYQSGGGFQWKSYKEHYPIQIKKFELPHVRKVLLYDMNGDFIREYPSIRQAAINIGGNPTYVTRSCNYFYPYKGYKMRFFTKGYPMKLKPFDGKRKQEIYQYSLNGDFIKKWDSILSAAKELHISVGNICHHLQEENRVCQGYYFSRQPKEFSIYRREHPFQKKIIITNLVTNEILEFYGKREACRKLDINRSTMSNALNKNNGIMSHKQLKIEEV